MSDRSGGSKALIRLLKAFSALAVLLGLAGMPEKASATEKCVAPTISHVGKCHHRGFARRVVDRELHGREKSSPVPTGVDVKLLATQLEGELAEGDIYPIGRSRNDWVLLTRRMTRNIYQTEHPANLYLLRIVPESPKAGRGKHSLVTVIGTVGTSLLISDDENPDRAQGGDAKSSAVQRCYNAEEDAFEENGYPRVGGEWRWQRLPSGRQWLVVPLSRSEGYAGGGGAFSAEMLLAINDGALTPIACYQISRYQMFGGNWNPDGSREHPESQAAWRVGFSAERGDQWPAIHLRAVTSKTPSAQLRWNPGMQYYQPRR